MNRDAAQPESPDAAQSEPTDAGRSADAALDIPDFNGCTAADYEDRSADDASRVISIVGGGLTYSPKCLIIAAGQTVRWEGSLSAHPLAPGRPDDAAAGSPSSPILETSTGKSVAFSFAAAGTFPYYCTIHAFGEGQGMAGSIHVR